MFGKKEEPKQIVFPNATAAFYEREKWLEGVSAAAAKLEQQMVDKPQEELIKIAATSAAQLAALLPLVDHLAGAVYQLQAMTIGTADTVNKMIKKQPVQLLPLPSAEVVAAMLEGMQADQ